MNELIAGRVMRNEKDKETGQQVDKSTAEIIAEAILEGMQGKLILYQNQYGDVIANPLHAIKLCQDYMLKSREQAISAGRPRTRKMGAAAGSGSCCCAPPRILS